MHYYTATNEALTLILPREGGGGWEAHSALWFIKHFTKITLPQTLPLLLFFFPFEKLSPKDWLKKKLVRLWLNSVYNLIRFGSNDRNFVDFHQHFLADFRAVFSRYLDLL